MTSVKIKSVKSQFIGQSTDRLKFNTPMKFSLIGYILNVSICYSFRIALYRMKILYTSTGNQVYESKFSQMAER